MLETLTGWADSMLPGLSRSLLSRSTMNVSRHLKSFNEVLSRPSFSRLKNSKEKDFSSDSLVKHPDVPELYGAVRAGSHELAVGLAVDPDEAIYLNKNKKITNNKIDK